MRTENSTHLVAFQTYRLFFIATAKNATVKIIMTIFCILGLIYMITTSARLCKMSCTFAVYKACGQPLNFNYLHPG